MQALFTDQISVTTSKKQNANGPDLFLLIASQFLETLFFNVYGCFVCIYVVHCMYAVPSEPEQGRVFDPLGLELETIVNCYWGARNQTQGLWKTTAKPFLQLDNLVFCLYICHLCIYKHSFFFLFLSLYVRAVLLYDDCCCFRDRISLCTSGCSAMFTMQTRLALNSRRSTCLISASQAYFITVFCLMSVSVLFC